MIWLLRMIAGSKIGRIVALVLVVISISFTTIQLWERGIRNQVFQEVETESLKREIQTRGRIDEALRNSPRDVDAAIRMLEDRQSRK